MEVDGHTTPQVCAVTGATYRQLDHWARTGRVHPINGDDPGQGFSRLWAEPEITVIRYTIQLLTFGLDLDHAITYARQLGTAGIVVVRTPNMHLVIVIDEDQS